MKYDYKKLYINGELVDAVSKTKVPVICPGTEETPP